MSTSPTMPVSTASFDTSATYEPTISPSTVLITGSATNAGNIASIDLYDNGNEIGLITGFRTSNTGWSETATLSPGSHFITATVTELSGATYGVFAPYELVTGIKNQPYVYQERDQNSRGVVASVSSYDASGTLVSQSAVAVNGSSAAPFTVAFDLSTTFVGATEATITGTTSAYGSAATIEIYDGAESSVINPRTGALLGTALALGYATVGPDGTWSFDANVSPGYHQFTAVATSLTGQESVAQSPFALQTGIVGRPYVFEEIDHGSSGSVAATTLYAADGSTVSRSNGGGVTVNGGSATGEVLQSQYDDVMTGDGTGSTTFLFKPGFGQDEITNFNYDNSAQPHDFISVPRSEFASMASLLHHITTALDGDAVIHLDRRDSIKVDGISKAELITHPSDFRFHL